MAVKKGKVEKVMKEYKESKLHSGSKKGPVVKNKSQDVAMSKAKMTKKSKGK